MRFERKISHKHMSFPNHYSIVTQQHHQAMRHDSGISSLLYCILLLSFFAYIHSSPGHSQHIRSHPKSTQHADADAHVRRQPDTGTSHGQLRRPCHKIIHSLHRIALHCQRQVHHRHPRCNNDTDIHRHTRTNMHTHFIAFVVVISHTFTHHQATSQHYPKSTLSIADVDAQCTQAARHRHYPWAVETFMP